MGSKSEDGRDDVQVKVVEYRILTALDEQPSQVPLLVQTLEDKALIHNGLNLDAVEDGCAMEEVITAC